MACIYVTAVPVGAAPAAVPTIQDVYHSSVERLPNESEQAYQVRCVAETFAGVEASVPGSIAD